MKLTPARRRMLEALSARSMSRGKLFNSVRSHTSGCRVLMALCDAGLASTKYMESGTCGPEIRCTITDAGRAALAST